jgi:multidrug efflux pump subunit AcrB
MISGVTFGAERQIRRAKSASSVPRHRQAPSMQLDPEIAKRHAMAAASRAMQRASERSSNESRGSWEYAGGAEKVSDVALPPRRSLDL